MSKDQSPPLIDTEPDCEKKSAGNLKKTQAENIASKTELSSAEQPQHNKLGLLADSELQNIAQSLNIKDASGMHRDELLAVISQRLAVSE